VEPKSRRGLDQSYQVVETLIEEHLKVWNYSRSVEDHDTTYFFLLSSSLAAPTYYHQKYFFDGVGVLRYFTFLLAQYEHDDHARFPSLWPWIDAKIRPREMVVVRTHLLISQEVFTLSYAPASREQGAGGAPAGLFEALMDDPSIVRAFPIHQTAFISAIRFGEQLLLSLNVTSQAAPRRPYFDQILLHAVRDVLSGEISRPEFDEQFPGVSFNVSARWNPLDMETLAGQSLRQVTQMDDLSTEALLDVVSSWRHRVLHADPLQFYPIAAQARSLRLGIGDPAADALSLLQREVNTHKDLHTEEATILQDAASHRDVEPSHEESHDRDTQTQPLTENGDGNGEENGSVHEHEHEHSRKRVLEAGEVVQIHLTRCAIGFLPPQSILEMFWELTFIGSVITFAVIAIFSYLTLGSIVHQLVNEGVWRLPFFIHVYETTVRVRFIYLWA